MVSSFAGMRCSWTSDGPGAIEVDLRPQDISTDWTPGVHKIFADYGGPVFGGFLENLSQSGPPGDIRYTASGLGFASRLDYRIVRYGDLVIRDSVDAIVAALLEEAQTQRHGNLGWSMGTVSGTYPSRLREYCWGANIGESIRELATIGRGFDWEVDADGHLNMWSPSRGVHTGRTLTINDGIMSWEASADTSDYVNVVTTLGDASKPYGPRHAVNGSLDMANLYGRREIAVDVDTNDAHGSDEKQELLDFGDAMLKERMGAAVRVHTMWIDDLGPWNFGDVWLQDWLTIDLPDYLGGSNRMRCTEVQVTLEPGIHMYIEHTFERLIENLIQDDEDIPA